MRRIHHWIRFAVSVAGLSVLARDSAAQDAASLEKNARVRVIATGRDGQHNRVLEIGKLQRLDGNAALISRGGTDRLVLIDSNRTLEVSRNRRRHTAIGALIGLGIGGLAGLATPCDNDGSNFGTPSCEDVRRVAPALFGSAGLLLGAAIGHGMVTEDWQPVRLEVGVTPGIHSQFLARLTIRR